MDTASKTKTILDLLGSEPCLRSKRELIEEFITTYMPAMKSPEQTHEAFQGFWTEKRDKEFDELCAAENLDRAGFAHLLEVYQFSGKRPLTDEVVAIMNVSPGILQRKASAERIMPKLESFIETFDEGIGEIEAP